MEIRKMGSVKEKLSPSRRVWRGAKTLFFLITMLASLLLLSAPLLIAIIDMFLPWALLSAFSSPLSLKSISSQLGAYDFRSSLVDIPLVSTFRSLLILCVYCVCDGPGRSRGPYLGITMLSSVVTVAYISLKASVFGDLIRWRRAIVDGGQYWREGLAMEALFMSSLVLAVAHLVVAYKISCRERRKLLVYRIDIEAVQVCKYGVHGQQKIYDK